MATDERRHIPMSRAFEKWILVGLGLIVFLIVLGADMAYRNIGRLGNDALSVARTLEVLDALGDISSSAKDAETGQRGFLITGELRDLEPYRAAVAVLGRQIERVSDLTSADPAHRSRIARLRKGLEARLEEMDETIIVRGRDGFEAARKIVLTDRGKVAMEEIRSAIEEMEDEERDLLGAREVRSARSYQIATATGLLTAAMGLGIVFAFTFLLRRYLIGRMDSEAAIFHEKDGFRTTISSIGDAVIVTDTGGRVTSINAVARSLTGWPEAEAIGRPLAEVFRTLDERTREVVENPVTKVLEGGLTVGLANNTILVAKDGREHPIDDSAAPIRDADKEIRGVVLVFRDVTERRQAERSLVEAKAYAESIVDTVREPLLVLGPDLRVNSASRAFYRTFGVKTENVQGRSFFELDTCRWEIQALRERLEAILVDGASFEDFEVDCFLSDAGRRVMRLSASGLYRDGGQPDLILVAIEDVTKQKQAEGLLRQQADALKQADSRKDEFLATLAHELRNPLAPIRNSLYIMRLAGDDREAIEACREVIDRQVLQLVRLVDDLLDISRISRNRLELKKEPVDLAEVLASSVEASRPLAERQGVDLGVFPPRGPIRLDADPVRLAQVFSNLLNNACKYTERGGHVRLTAGRQGDEAVVAVEDDGVGIPAEMLHHIFDMFTQVDRSIDRSQGGLGIGLTLVRRLVEMHGGRVEARSDGPGRGSEFIVRLPIAVDKAGTATSGESEGIAPFGAPARRILVVDDNRDTADSLAKMLQVLGNEVLAAYHGGKAVELAEDFHPDLAFIDIGLPGIDGHEVARQIRFRPWGRATVLVALTGWGQEEDRRLSTEAGFDHHLVKPAEFEALSKILARPTRSLA